TVRLRGDAGNLHATGSLVELETPAGAQRRWITGGGSYQSVDATDAYFGLGSEPAVELTVRVRWPDGTVRKLDGAPRDRLLVMPAAPSSGVTLRP
ncbi:MAG: ASPIC/UnbV domain-containing protein, partial [Acidobacteriota bacterium]|nr:ASPIC/UnbV domain-containing protein [Acidobacteriota bacterium]